MRVVRIEPSNLSYLNVSVKFEPELGRPVSEAENIADNSVCGYRDVSYRIVSLFIGGLLIFVYGIDFCDECLDFKLEGKS